MKRVELTQGYHALVSDDDYERVTQHKWCVSRESRKGKKLYAIRWAKKSDPEYIPGRQIKIRMHRWILDLPPGYLQPEWVVDHLDADGLNNQRENLRIVTQEENMKDVVGFSRKKSEEPWL